MSASSLIDAGEFEQALAELKQATHGGGTAEQLLSRFNVEMRLGRFNDARASLKRLFVVEPKFELVLGKFMHVSIAEEKATRRLSDPALAGKRSAVGLPSPQSMAYVKMALAHAQRDAGGARAAHEEAKGLHAPVRGVLEYRNGQSKPFEDLVDTDDLTGPTLPCYEGDALLDIPYRDLLQIRLLEAKTTLDVMWFPAELTLVDGSTLTVRIPSLYPGTGQASRASVRTGQETIWSYDAGYAVGQGQRDFRGKTADGGEFMTGMLNLIGIRFQNERRALVPPGNPQARRQQASGQQGSGLQPVDRPWTSTEKSVAAVGAVAALITLLRPGLLLLVLPEPTPGIFRAVAILLGLVASGCAWWLGNQVSTRKNAMIGAGVMAGLTLLKWGF